MKKIGIITINDYMNYGNRLQNYATQEVLKSLNFQVETIRYLRNKNNIGYLKAPEKLKKIIKLPAKEKNKLVQSKFNNYLHKKTNLQKKANFLRFTEKFIVESDFVITDEDMHVEQLDTYSYFVVGSDQVWNPMFNFGTEIDFLAFAPKEKRIAYAPSFGISKLPIQFHSHFKELLNEMKALSVRENAGAEIVKQLTGKSAEVLLDPTLMLPKEQWEKVQRFPMNKPKKKFLLTYFLGEVPNEYQKVIKKTSDEKNLDIINLGSLKYKDYYTVDPSIFLYFFNEATMIMTDSFHGCVFSIIFEKPFIVFERKENGTSMNSRIDTLLKKFELESRTFDNLKESHDIFKINYSHVAKILEEEKKKSLEYLTVSLRANKN